MKAAKAPKGSGGGGAAAEAPAAPVALVAPSLATQYRSHSCDELRMDHVGQEVKLCGWVQVSE